MIGKTLNSRYRIEERLGRGGMGSVYRTLDIALNQRVAIKVLPSHISVSPENEKRFEREFIALTNLHHPNIISVYDFGRSDGVIFFVMEYLSGHDLRWHFRSKPKKNEDFVNLIRLFDKVCQALSYMHSKGIIHRDLKPQNIFLQKDGEPKLMDFGLAKLVDASNQITQEGAVLGTATYMAPEQASGKDIDERSDIYSLGVILYHALCQKPPFTGSNPIEVLNKHLYEKPPKPRYNNPFIPKQLVTLLDKALEKDPKKRFQNAGEMSHDLQITLRILEDTKILKVTSFTNIIHKIKGLFNK